MAGRHYFTLKQPADSAQACLEYETQVTDRQARHNAAMHRIEVVRNQAVIATYHPWRAMNQSSTRTLDAINHITARLAQALTYHVIERGHFGLEPSRRFRFDHEVALGFVLGELFADIVDARFIFIGVQVQSLDARVQIHPQSVTRFGFDEYDFGDRRVHDVAYGLREHLVVFRTIDVRRKPAHRNQ